MRLWKPPTYIGFQAPVPPPPDYSSPAAVNARIREFCGRAWCDKAAHDRTLGKLYAELRLAVERALARTSDEDEIAPRRAGGRAIPCPVEDWHVSKWDVVRGEHGYELQPRKAV